MNYNTDCETNKMYEDNLFNEIKWVDDSKEFQIIIQEDSKWTTELKILKNPETGKPYSRYITTIEADHKKTYGYKMLHQLTYLCPGVSSHDGAEWIKLETKGPLKIDEPILVMSYMKQNDNRFPWVSFDSWSGSGFKLSKIADVSFGWDF